MWKSLETRDLHDLLNSEFDPTKFCVDTLIPHGLSVLAGAPKIGKSWLVLDLCVHIASGELLWGLPVRQSSVLYLALEDKFERVTERAAQIADDVPPGSVIVAVRADSIASALLEQVREQIEKSPQIELVIIDTLGAVRNRGKDSSYNSDYDDINALKQLADELDIAILLVHHMRKRKDDDVFNMFSGTTGLIGAADAMFALVKDNRFSNRAILSCTGRDIEERQISLSYDPREHTWALVEDSLAESLRNLPDELFALVELMRERGSYSGGNTELAKLLSDRLGFHVHPRGFKQKMHKWREKLEDSGVRYHEHSSGGTKLIDVNYTPPASSDVNNANDAKSASTSEEADADGAATMEAAREMCDICDISDPDTLSA